MPVLKSILFYLFLIAQGLVALYLLIPFILLVFFGLRKLFNARPSSERKPFLTDKDFEFGIIITAHQETKFVVPLVDSILKQEYQGFYIYIVADDCNPGELQFNDERISILYPAPALHSKIRSIHYGISAFRKKHDAVIILDADNLIHPSFLSVMNRHFQKGYRVVQSDFKPKNTDTHFARMDAIGDMFNFFVEREARLALDLSSAIWGSGVAIDLDLYNGVEYTNLLGGFDKKLQAHLVKSVKRIAFAPGAILYDEKISSGQSLENQRTRWISSYFKYLGESFGILTAGLRRGSFNLFYFGFITLRPPLFIILGLSCLFAIIDYFIYPAVFYGWLGIFACFVFSFIIIVLVKGKDLRYLPTLFLLPVFAVRQFLALLKIKKAKKSFLKTTHTRLVFIDELLKKK